MKYFIVIAIVLIGHSALLIAQTDCGIVWDAYTKASAVGNSNGKVRRGDPHGVLRASDRRRKSMTDDEMLPLAGHPLGRRGFNSLQAYPSIEPARAQQAERRERQNRECVLDPKASPGISLHGQMLSDDVSSAASDTIVESWTRHYAPGLAPANDEATAIAVDGVGNVYVTGYSSSTSLFGGTDYYTVKYAPTGVALWGVRYNGGGNDIARAIAVDTSGNVYVTGSSAGLGTPYDYATVKYNAEGIEQWVARYNGPGSSNDDATAITVDASGNVYVTGSSYGSGTRQDYATVKYNASGIQQWVARYNGPGNRWDIATAIGVDTSGNVYVTGAVDGRWTEFGYIPGDYGTITYTASGVELWVALYNGPGNGSDGANGLAVDAAGNVYVTGPSSGAGTSYDYTTIKYNADGQQQWVARYNGPGNGYDYATAIAVDASGNVYVTGGDEDNYWDYATVKYNASGLQQWVARYNGPGDGFDQAAAIAVDGQSNVYVTGVSIDSSSEYDYATVKYNDAGVEQWVVRYNGPVNLADFAVAIAVDASGNVCVTGGSKGTNLSYDYLTIKYNTLGVEQWVARDDGPGSNWGEATAIALDGQGNVYVTGMSVGSGSYWDYATVKYNASGVQQWVARYNGTGNFDDRPTAIAVDSQRNVYVTGWSYGSGTFIDYVTVKYNAAGVEQWVARYNGPGNDRDEAAAIAVDEQGNVYVTGSSTDVATATDYVTIKYNVLGQQEWLASYDGPGNDWDDAQAIVLDGFGNVYVTGRSVGSGTSYDYATIKYNAAGIEEWVARYNGPQNGIDDATAIGLDAVGNVYVTGYSYGIGTLEDYATIKYNAAGVEQWVARYYGAGNFSDYARAIAVDAQGNVYATGSSYVSSTSSDFATIKYSTSGQLQWAARYNGPGSSYDHARAIALDPSGNVYVLGSSYGSGTSYDYATIKYNASGIQQWVARYNGPGNSYDRAAAIAVDVSDGSIYVTGYSRGAGWSVYTTIKYEQLPVTVQEQDLSLPDTFALAQNYPNPFNPTTTIAYQLPKAAHVIIKLYDVLGREVETLVDETKEGGFYRLTVDVSSLSSGVYFYRMTADSYTAVKKLAVIR